MQSTAATQGAAKQQQRRPQQEDQQEAGLQGQEDSSIQSPEHQQEPESVQQEQREGDGKEQHLQRGAFAAVHMVYAGLPGFVRGVSEVAPHLLVVCVSAVLAWVVVHSVPPSTITDGNGISELRPPVELAWPDESGTPSELFKEGALWPVYVLLATVALILMTTVCSWGGGSPNNSDSSAVWRQRQSDADPDTIDALTAERRVPVRSGSSWGFTSFRDSLPSSRKLTIKFCSFANLVNYNQTKDVGQPDSEHA